jgi:hypothetical protein
MPSPQVWSNFWVLCFRTADEQKYFKNISKNAGSTRRACMSGCRHQERPLSMTRSTESKYCFKFQTGRYVLREVIKLVLIIDVCTTSVLYISLFSRSCFKLRFPHETKYFGTKTYVGKDEFINIHLRSFKSRF